MRRPTRALTAALCLGAAGALLVPAASAPTAAAAPDLKGLLRGDASCPAGTAVPTEREAVAGPSDGVLPGDLSRVDPVATAKTFGVCVRGKLPESQLQLSRFAAIQATQAGADSADQLRAGVVQRAALATSAPVAGSSGSWKPLGVGPLITDDPAYTDANGFGTADISGRISDFAFSPLTKTLWATAAQGGVWASQDRGVTWRSIGDGLPFQSTSGLAWTSAGSSTGTLLVLTGDHAFSNDYAGLGAYWTTDNGAHWNHAAGVPDGALGFRLAVDPTNPKVVYAATGKGLFRSTDGGRSYTDAKIASKEATCKTSSEVNCFFANIVTDVEVQSTDTFGHKGGAVVAALGWRAGRYPNFNGKPQAPHNGVFRSDNGLPGTFTRLADGSGITDSADFGRTEFGGAHGPAQDSSWLYAVVQNSSFFTTGQDTVSDSINGDPLGVGVNPLAKTSDLDGIYVSPDFGKTWRILSSGRQMANPANGSALNPLSALGISAGFQVTYNEWIEPDPTRASLTGVPTRLTFGLEELWHNPVPVPLDGTGAVDTPLGKQGTAVFTTIGAYSQAGACLLVAAAPACSAGRVQDDPLQTTTHPDQHAAIYLTDPEAPGQVQLVVGNDGGVYTQTTDQVTPFTQAGFGKGSQTGFHDLLPYGIAMAKDGTAYMGLQDNGTARIDGKTGRQVNTHGGDGIFALTEPDNSDVVYEEQPAAGIYVSTNGAKSYTDIGPNVTDADFVAPMVMDVRNPKHIITGGREIVETTEGPAVTASTWRQVYNLGTKSQPGSSAVASQADPNNHVVALGVDGPAIYAGFCGSCDPVKLHQKFAGGLATNVGGAEAPKTGSGAGWHIAKAKGLPQRRITSATVDPKDHRTVYVTLGASAARYFAPLGSLGEDTSKVGTGYVFKSTDAGATFTDITGDLPKVQATWSLLRNGQLVVATAVGAFTSSGTSGGHYAPLGTGAGALPAVPIFQMQLKPGNPNVLVAATFGRGAYTYTFSKGTSPVTTPVKTPTTGTGSGSKGPLPATGLGLALPLAGLVLVAGTVLLRRRRTA